MTRGRTKKSDKLPKYGDVSRNILLSIVPSLEVYRDTLKKGVPVLFTEEELIQFKDKYKAGITWDEVDKELSQKGIPLKKVTFRKYIQDGFLPKAKKYNNTEKGRIAIFPADTIEHINFIHFFYNAAGKQQIENILDLLLNNTVTYREAVESREQWNRPMYASILHYICFRDGAVYEAIENALSTRPKDRETVLKMLGKIDDKFQAQIGKEIDKFIEFLESKRLPLIDVNK